MKKINSLLLVVAFMISTSVMAEGYCNEYRNKMSCNDAYNCLWTGFECVDVDDTETQEVLDVCLQAQGIDDCNSLSECTWYDGICLKSY